MVLRELIFECVKANLYMDPSVLRLSVELHRVLNDMKQGLPVDVPVRAGPFRNRVALAHLNLDLIVPNLLVERLQKLENHLADGLFLLGLEVAHEHLGGELSVRHLAHEHVGHDLGGAPDDSCDLVRLPEVVSDPTELVLEVYEAARARLSIKVVVHYVSVDVRQENV